jgi:tripartite-type tricarboxylate transporter receptor subunit TctC
MIDACRTRCVVAVFLLMALGAFGADSARGETYPSRPVRLIVPFAAGGLNDVVARLIGPYLERSLGQPFIVENRPAASGIVGTDATAKAAPDGHTLLMVASSFTVVPATHAKLPYDPERDLAPIAMVAKSSLLFLVNPKVPANSLAQFVAFAKANPGKLNYASPGAATQTHLVIELFSRKADIKMQHIPYRGGAPAMTAMVAGETQFTAISTLLSLPQIQTGALRAIATGSLSRDAQLPDLPTVAEQGFPGFEAIQWIGLLTTASTPKDVTPNSTGRCAIPISSPSSRNTASRRSAGRQPTFSAPSPPISRIGPRQRAPRTSRPSDSATNARDGERVTSRMDCSGWEDRTAPAVATDASPPGRPCW